MASITSMGPDTPMDLSKASPSQPTPSKPRFQRWYLEETTGQPRVVGTERAESSVMVNSNEEWKCSLKQKGEMLEGWYWVTLSVTFDQIQVDNLDSMTFSVLQADENHISYDQVWSSTTVLDNNEIRNIPREKNRRLRLLRQVYIKPMDPTGYVEITISFGTGATGSFEVHYVEIEEGGIQPTGQCISNNHRPFCWSKKSVEIIT
ncbi:hypothetical protein BC939DRAFT_119649 [Gamsiella multidivaricata]|uniref:uncharacterized protein n=1 Tax=Gamsiella multidivaricata TaxID=101098 RepID=UPI00221FF221|nr:uncharacterized protein BC939DRAFT_119649 [Gamsiella multidivaricata]KAI7826057.1 hypothetical protein BC939DRAFT_119649 [Gamsiella multidivaricata]